MTRPARSAAPDRYQARQSEAPVAGTTPHPSLTPVDDRDEARVGRDGPDLATPPGLFDGPLCAVCSAPLEAARTGRPRTTCSDACRQNASRACHETRSGLGHQDAPLRAATLAAIAAAIPTPVDERGPARAYVEVRDGGHGVVFGLAGGRLHRPAGPAFPRPRPALDLADLLNTRLPTPSPAARSVHLAADVAAGPSRRRPPSAGSPAH